MGLVKSSPAFTSGIPKKSDTSNNNSPKGEVAKEPTGTSSQQSKKPYVIPQWKKHPLASSESKTKLVDNHTYHWCSKCRNGDGMWALHQEQAHLDDFKRYKSNNSKSSNTGTSKAVSFNVRVDKNLNASDENVPKLQVKGELLSDAKAFLMQFTDFLRGGV